MPSRSRRIEVLCPECRAPNPFVQWEVVDAAENPPLMDRILEGTLFDFVCTNCEEEITLEFSARFEDHAAALIVKYEAPRGPALEEPWIPGEKYRLRRVSDQNAFTELARIWKDSLDDSAMLVMKHMLARDVEEQHRIRPLVCGYEGLGEVDGEPCLSFIVWLPQDNEPRAFSVSSSVYEEIRARLPADAESTSSGERWVDWDSAAAQRIYDVLNSAAAGS